MTGQFAQRLAEVDQLTRRWRVGKAFYAARQLVSDFPTEPDAYTLYNMLICITNNGGGQGGGLRHAPSLLIAQAVRNIPGFQETFEHGDLLRDQLLGLTRFPVGDSLIVARDLPEQIERLHATDANRMACLTDARARLAAAEGDLDGSWVLHSTAHQEWLALDSANPSWMYFNLVHWLRVSIELWGHHHPRTQKVRNLLRGDKPAGAHRDLQIDTICVPMVGLRTYRWLETHRM